MKKIINYQYFLYLSLSFVLFTVIGTLSHEFGHILVAKSLGYETTLHYGSMNYHGSELTNKLNDIHNRNLQSITEKHHFIEQELYTNLLRKSLYNSLLIAIGGPLQTILTGTIGLILLLYQNAKIQAHGMKIFDWFSVLLSLFWLREIFNLLASVSAGILSGSGNYFSGDELHIAWYLQVWEGTFAIVLGIMGLLISLFVIFKIIPKQWQITFIVSGLVGGSLGFVLWMKIVGPILLP
ncbi:hypothetical protein [Flexibacter flexilis]|nr:hypothetical protein [Flexibacter flexilis]